MGNIINKQSDTDLNNSLDNGSESKIVQRTQSDFKNHEKTYLRGRQLFLALKRNTLLVEIMKSKMKKNKIIFM